MRLQQQEKHQRRAKLLVKEWSVHPVYFFLPFVALSAAAESDADPPEAGGAAGEI